MPQLPSVVRTWFRSLLTAIAAGRRPSRALPTRPLAHPSSRAILDPLFLDVSVRGFPVQRPALHDAALLERYDCARSATSRANSPTACTCQHVTVSDVVPAHEVSLDGVLSEQHRHRIVNVNRRNITVRFHGLQSLNQSLLEYVGHHAFQLIPADPLRKGKWTQIARAFQPKLRQFPVNALYSCMQYYTL